MKSNLTFGYVLRALRVTLVLIICKADFLIEAGGPDFLNNSKANF
jgi:hypothetical protein